MMGKGAEGGCKTNGCTGSAGVCSLPPKAPVYSGLMSRMSGKLGHERRGLDVFSQALKLLAVKPAFGELGTSSTGGSSLNTALSCENKRKQRIKKNDVNGSLVRDPFENSWYKDSNGGPFWLLMEEYFREPSPQDIQLLLPKTRVNMWTLVGSVDSLLQLPVPFFSNEPSKETQLPAAPNLLQPDTCCQDEQNEHGMQDTALKRLEQHRKSTKRKMAASGPANKRRRMMAAITDVVMADISPSEHHDGELCHVCYAGESDENNQMLICDSCNVAVHQECYGVKVNPEKQWLCSLCRHESSSQCDTLQGGLHNCAFCPVKGGALKQIASPTEQSSSKPTVTRFGHLFCCRWIPETYIGDKEAMEPIMNIEGVREERWKLLCSICKDKHGACIQCSHGMCATAFHPLCARQAKLRMDVSSKENGEEMELHAYCPKHTPLDGKPVLGRQADRKISFDAVDADEGTMNTRSLSKTANRLKLASSKCENGQVFVVSVADCDETTHEREINTNGGLSIEGLMDRNDSPMASLDAIQVKKNGQGDTESTSVLQESLCRLGGGIKMHPFLITRLLQVLGKTAPNDTQIETEKPAQFSQSPDSLPSPFPSTELPSFKVSRSRRFQSEVSSHKYSLKSTSAKNDLVGAFETQLKQLEYAKRIGVLDMASGNELEEEIFAAQLNLIVQAHGNNHQREELVMKIIQRLPQELRSFRKRLKDLNLVRQYLSMLQEAKKQGRKERKSKEAQEVLAATTAVAAASSRLGASRRDASVSKDEKLLTRDSFCKPTVPTLQSHGICHAVRSNLQNSLGYGRTSSSHTSSCGKVSSIDQDLKGFDLKTHAAELNSGESQEEPILCDVCKETSVLSPTAFCQRCKVVVHQQCYSINFSLTSDWFCQPCLGIKHQSQGIDVSDVVERATPGHGVLCFLCFGLSGAFKKAADGKWAHVFCLQWFPEFSDKDEAISHEPTKMLSIEKNVQECSICHLKQGARLRCSFGHCHGTFHPLCARDSGLYMSVKRSTGGRIQLRAYCEKHSTQQRQKAASRKYGSADELNVLLRLRAELERVRILCERVCKRERLKRERLLCTLDIYTAQLLSFSSSAMASNDLSSTSNTFGTTVAFRKMSSLQNDAVVSRPYHHGLESESISWNDVAGEGSKYQDSVSSDSVYQTPISCSELSRETLAMSRLTDAFHIQGKMNMLVGMVSKDCEQRRLERHQKSETLHTELIMTPMEASVQNQRLPKGYAYVPVGTLPKGNLNLSETSILKDR